MEVLAIIIFGFVAFVFIVDFGYLAMRMFPPKKGDVLYRFYVENIKPKKKKKQEVKKLAKWFRAVSETEKLDVWRVLGKDGNANLKRLCKIFWRI